MRGRGHNEANLVTDLEDRPGVWRIECDCGYSFEGSLDSAIDDFKIHHHLARL